jgi:SAM-dependent methyltransferase
LSKSIRGIYMIATERSRARTRSAPGRTKGEDLTMTRYDATFYEYVNSGATRSAVRILPMLSQAVGIGTVLDVGCGQGAWLAVWKSLGAEVTGIDGAHVDRARLLIPAESFLPLDLTQPFDLTRRFDLVQCLEVAEHLPAERAAGLIDNLVRHGDLVLFSAAAKGQGGLDHLNEQDYDYWRALFARHGYVALDYLRPRLRNDLDIEPWYRYNTILYASWSRLQGLPDRIRASRVTDDVRLADVSPILYQVRKAVVRLLPVPLMSLVARLKERLAVRLQARSGCRRSPP